MDIQSQGMHRRAIAVAATAAVVVVLGQSPWRTHREVSAHPAQTAARMLGDDGIERYVPARLERAACVSDPNPSEPMLAQWEGQFSRK